MGVRNYMYVGLHLVKLYEIIVGVQFLLRHSSYLCCQYFLYQELAIMAFVVVT